MGKLWKHKRAGFISEKWHQIILSVFLIDLSALAMWGPRPIQSNVEANFEANVGTYTFWILFVLGALLLLGVVIASYATNYAD